MGQAEIVIVYQKETDGEILVEKVTVERAEEITKNLSPYDYALIGGEIYKDFDTKDPRWDHIKRALQLVQKNR